ncbi:hypothetical protein [Capnocytophaga canis]|uniref:hypothetical protein n=1 Tax=Capnocytophaga canis TaxID=1848903 RepID=UPI00385B49E6
MKNNNYIKAILSQTLRLGLTYSPEELEDRFRDIDLPVMNPQHPSLESEVQPIRQSGSGSPRGERYRDSDSSSVRFYGEGSGREGTQGRYYKDENSTSTNNTRSSGTSTRSYGVVENKNPTDNQSRTPDASVYVNPNPAPREVPTRSENIRRDIERDVFVYREDLKDADIQKGEIPKDVPIYKRTPTERSEEKPKRNFTSLYLNSRAGNKPAKNEWLTPTNMMIGGMLLLLGVYWIKK